MTELHLNTSELTQVHINGRLVGEVAVGQWIDRDTLQAEVNRARCLEAIPRILQSGLEDLLKARDWDDHILAKTPARQQAWAQGFVAGMTGETVPHPDPGVPDILPDSGRSYEAGYHVGEALRRIVRETGQVLVDRGA